MTGISDRCKTAREKATPGPWRSYFDVGYYSVAADDGWPVATDVKDEDAALIALAPEAADEVVRLTGQFEALADTLDDRADKCAANKEYVAAVGHRATAEHIRKKILNPNGDTND